MNFRNLQNFATLRSFATCEILMLLPLFTFPSPFDFCSSFDFFPFYPCNSQLLLFILVICIVLGQYISPSKHCNRGDPFCSLIKFMGGNLSAVLALSHFLSFSLTSQTPFEDDNSEDEWLEPLSP